MHPKTSMCLKKIFMTRSKFDAIGLSLYPQENIKNKRFYDIFRGYRKSLVV